VVVSLCVAESDAPVQPANNIADAITKGINLVLITTPARNKAFTKVIPIHNKIDAGMMKMTSFLYNEWN
jgi:hypothetical protein